MGTKGLIVCVCQGTCPSFHKMDVFAVLNAIRKKKLVDFVSLHPQLCAKDGDEYLRTLLTNGDIDRLYVGACDPLMQEKMFVRAFNDSEFDPSRHFSVDIRNMTTEEAIAAITKLIEDNP